MLCRLTRINLKSEASFNTNHRNRKSIYFQLKVYGQSRLVVYAAASLHTGPGKTAKFHISVEPDLEPFIVKLQVKGALNSKNRSYIKLATAFNDQGVCLNGTFFEFARNVPGLRVDVKTVDFCGSTPRVDGKPEIATEREQIRSHSCSHLQLKAAHDAFAVDIQEPTGTYHSQRTKLCTGCHKDGNSFLIAYLEVELSFQFKNASK